MGQRRHRVAERRSLRGDLRGPGAEVSGLRLGKARGQVRHKQPHRRAAAKRKRREVLRRSQEHHAGRWRRRHVPGRRYRAWPQALGRAHERG